MYQSARMSELLEISDLIVDYDPQSLVRRDVRRSEVVKRLRQNGQYLAASIARKIPADNDVLDRNSVDLMLLRAHSEIQRLSEEFSQGERVRRLLRPIVEALWARGVRPVRIADVGCGIGYVVRWMAKHWPDPDIEWLGFDYNAALIGAAQALARQEELGCEFVVGNVFRLDEPVHIFMSTGVIHHFRGESLRDFFAQQRATDAAALVHFDIQPTWLSPFGAFIFHHARFAEPLGQHDGWCSARRAHTGGQLITAATDPSGEWLSTLFDHHDSIVPVFRVMQAVLSLRADLVDDVVARIDFDPSRLGPFK